MNVVTNGSVTPRVIGCRPRFVGTAAAATAWARAAGRELALGDDAAARARAGLEVRRDARPAIAWLVERSAAAVAFCAAPVRSEKRADSSSGSWLRFLPSRFCVDCSGLLIVSSSQWFCQ